MTDHTETALHQAHVALAAQAGRDQAAVARVRNLHRPAECVNVRCKLKQWCIGCDPDGIEGCDENPWPCPTIRALEAVSSSPATPASSWTCPTCGPRPTEPHPRQPVDRCNNCKEHAPDDGRADGHVCKPDATSYYCPTSGETESTCHGGFDTCCDRPGLHRPQPATDQAERRTRYATPLFAVMRQNGWDGERTERVISEMDLVLDAVMAVADAEQAERGEQLDEAAKSIAERTVEINRLGEVLAATRATNRRLNRRAQALESALATYRRAADQWEISERGTYIPHSSLRTIGKACGVDILGSVRHLKHFERVEQAEAAIERVREVLPFVEKLIALSGPGVPTYKVREIAERLNAALDGTEPPAAAPAVDRTAEEQPETPLEKRLRYSERRNDELRAECKRRGKAKLEYAEEIERLKKQLDEVRSQLGAEILRAGQAEAELRRMAGEEQQPEESEPAVTMHAIPLPGSNGISACCGRPPCEFIGERVTRDPAKVTCPGPKEQR